MIDFTLESAYLLILIFLLSYFFLLASFRYSEQDRHVIIKMFKKINAILILLSCLSVRISKLEIN